MVVKLDMPDISFRLQQYIIMWVSEDYITCQKIKYIFLNKLLSKINQSLQFLEIHCRSDILIRYSGRYCKPTLFQTTMQLMMKWSIIYTLLELWHLVSLKNKGQFAINKAVFYSLVIVYQKKANSPIKCFPKSLKTKDVWNWRKDNNRVSTCSVYNLAWFWSGIEITVQNEIMSEIWN